MKNKIMSNIVRNKIMSKINPSKIVKNPTSFLLTKIFGAQLQPQPLSHGVDTTVELV